MVGNPISQLLSGSVSPICPYYLLERNGLLWSWPCGLSKKREVRSLFQVGSKTWKALRDQGEDYSSVAGA